MSEDLKKNDNLEGNNLTDNNIKKEIEDNFKSDYKTEIIENNTEENIDEKKLEDNLSTNSEKGSKDGEDLKDLDEEDEKKTDAENEKTNFTPRKGKFYEHDDRLDEEDVVETNNNK